MKAPIALVILDGFGYRKETEHNAIAQARTPNFDAWLAQYPYTTLQAAGEHVGLLPGCIGNSEVGHLTIGSGRVIQQPVTRLHNAIDDGSFFEQETLVNALKQLTSGNGTLHLMGLLSDAGVHSHEKHLFALLQAARQQNVSSVVVHAFLDGRDVPPRSAANYLQRLNEQFKKIGIGKLGSIHGRFYAMDRDKNWERTEQAYRVLTIDQERLYPTWEEAIDAYYQQNTTDEFIPPTQLNSHSTIQNGDGIIFFNFRPDRARQLTETFVNPHFGHFDTKKTTLSFFMTPTDYNADIKTTTLLETPLVNNTLLETLSRADKTIFTVAETEKYAHVTYFFNGGRENKWPTETRKLIPSIAAQNYIATPEMSAPHITDAVLTSLKKDPQDFYLINYANADMVAHSGNMAATVKAIECLDEQLKQLYDVIVEQQNGIMYITGDHGNAETMFDPVSKQPQTAHTSNPVYFLALGPSTDKLSLTQLADIAPHVLRTMNLPVPTEMQKP